MTMATAKEYAWEEGFIPLSSSFSPPLSNTQAWAHTSTLIRYRSMSHNTQTPHHRLTPDPKTTPFRHGTHNTTGCACCCRPITSSEKCHGGVYLQTRLAHVAVIAPSPPVTYTAYTAATKRFNKTSWIYIRQRRGDGDDTLDTLSEAIRRDKQFKKKTFTKPNDYTKMPVFCIDRALYNTFIDRLL